MNSVAFIFLTFAAVDSGYSSDPSGNGFLKGEGSDNSSEAAVGGRANDLSDKEDYCKRSFDIPTRSDIAFINKTLGESLIMAGNSSDGIVAIESRLNSVENTLKSVEETLNKMRNAMEMNIPRCGHFDERAKGKNIRLYNHLRTAARTRPLEDDGVYGGVISNGPLLDDKVFTFRIDETIDKWIEYGLSLGVINGKSESVEEATHISYIEDTWGIIGRPNSSGKSTVHSPDLNVHEDAYPMDTRNLSVGTTLGIMRCSEGDVHFFLNGVDKGVAIGGVPEGVYAFVDVANYVTKISVVC